MSDIVLQITAPAHGAYIAGTNPVSLSASVAGDSTGLFFKWYSTLNALATAAQPELNANHGAASLEFQAALDVGSHVITLAAADQESSALPAVTAITRAAFTGGAPDPSNSTPCVVHRLLATPATLAVPLPSANVSKSNATIEVLPPSRWFKEDPPGSGVFVPDVEYRALHAIQYRVELRPEGAPDPAHTASVVLDLSSMSLLADHRHLRWQGALPPELGTGNHVLTLFVEKPDRSLEQHVSRTVSITA